jgi:succinate-semialdehyde dehydrogenase / glutarate-semialdehyde dehydrogenase
MAALPGRRELYIDGRWQPAHGDGKFSVADPATEAVLCAVADATPHDAVQAVDAAAAAFPAWSRLTGAQRARHLLAVRDLLAERADTVARIMTQEQGKPLGESRNEVDRCLDFLEWYAEEGKRVYGEVMPVIDQGRRQLALRQPQGVVLAITPWNFPAMMLARKAATALAAGCTVVAKPAEQTPLTAIALFEIFDEAGMPPGTVNLLTTADPASLGRVLLGDHRVRHLAFTGSTAVGKLLAKQAASQVRRVTLELGGHAPFVVFDDADLDLAAAHLLGLKFKNCGQTCVNPNRIFVHSEVAEDFAKRIATEVGPMIDHDGVAKVEAHVRDAVDHGARVLTGGSRLPGPGFWYAPTVLDAVDSRMRLFREETFGPVAPMLRFSSEDQLVAQANDTAYGLIAYVYTGNLGRALRMSEALEVGVMGVNDNQPGTLQAPFGGVKESGIGREGGRDGIQEFLDTKLVSFGVPRPPPDCA